MIPYFVMVGIPMSIAILRNKIKDNQYRNRLIIGSFFLIWLILLCLRNDTVGIDLINYEDIFLQSARLSLWDIFRGLFSDREEIGFYVLIKIISLFTVNTRVFIIVVAVASLVPVWLLYRNNARQNAYLSIVIFLTLGLFSIYCSALRQVLAMAFVFPAYEFTKKRKLWLFLLMVLFAFLFHHSAVIMLLMYPFYRVHLNWLSSLILIIPSLIIVYIFRKPIFLFLASFMGEFYSGNVGDTGAIMIFLLLIILLFYSYLIPDNTLLDEETRGLRNLLFVCAVLQVFSGVNLLAMRMNYYYLMLVPLLIPRVMNRASEKNRTIAEISCLVMAVFFTVFYFYRAYTSSDILNVYPYVPFWS